MAKFSGTRLCEILQEKYAVKMPKRGRYLINLGPYSDFPHEIGIIFSYNDDDYALKIHGVSTSFKVKAERLPDLYLFMNEWNRLQPLGQAYYDDGTGSVQISHCVAGIADLPEEYIRNWVIEVTIAMFGRFHAALSEKFQS